MMRRLVSSEGGSIPLAILVSIVVGGVLLVMFGNVRQSQRMSSFDRNYAAAVQVADAGLQAAFTHLITQPATPVGGILESDDVAVAIPTDVGDGDYHWLAYRTGPQGWQIRSEGSYGDVTRVLEASYDLQSLFHTAMYGHVDLDGNFPANDPHGPGHFSAGIGAYDSRTGQSVNVDNGEYDIIAGTSEVGDCSINPAPDSFDQIMYAEQGADTGGCTERRAPLPPFPDIGAKAFDEGGVCEIDDDGEFVQSDAAVLPDGPEAELVRREIGWDPHTTPHFQRGTVYCLKDDDLVLPNGHQALVQGESSDQHVEVYVEGKIVMEGSGQPARREINVEKNGDPPSAVDLRLFFADAGESLNFTGNNHTWLAATIYAPQRACEFRTQMVFYGAATCYSIQIGGGGGFNFHYDIATADIDADEVLVLQGWREESTATSEFDWTGIGD